MRTIVATSLPPRVRIVNRIMRPNERVLIDSAGVLTALVASRRAEAFDTEGAELPPESTVVGAGCVCDAVVMVPVDDFGAFAGIVLLISPLDGLRMIAGAWP